MTENRRLRQSASRPEQSRSDEVDLDEHGPKPAPSSRLPELASAPWFVNTAVRHTPILLGEASDSAFATRLRQAIPNSQHHSHLPRVHYTSDKQLLDLSDAPCGWPTPLQARLLVNVALKSLGRWHHIVRRSLVLERLEQSLLHHEQMGPVLQSQLWALFAIGQVFSTRIAATSEKFPGLEYFAKATKSLHFLSERPSIELVETWILLVGHFCFQISPRKSIY